MYFNISLGLALIYLLLVYRLFFSPFKEKINDLYDVTKVELQFISHTDIW